MYLPDLFNAIDSFVDESTVQANETDSPSLLPHRKQRLNLEHLVHVQLRGDRNESVLCVHNASAGTIKKARN